MTRSMWIALVLACTSGCSLDLDRLREGAGMDGGGRDDAGEGVDAGDVDGGGDSDAGARDDAGEPDAGGCGCAGGGWQKTPFFVGGTGVGHVSLADLDGDGDLDVVASRRGGVASLLRMSVVACGREGLITTPGEIADTVPDAIVALVDWNDDGVLDVAAPDPGTASLRTLTGNLSGTHYSVAWVDRGMGAPIEDATSVFALDLDGGDVAGVIALASDRVVVVLWRDGVAMTPHVFRTTGTVRDVAFSTPMLSGRLGAIAKGPGGVELVLLDPDGAPPLTAVSELLAPVTNMDIADVHFIDVDGDLQEDLVVLDVGRGLLLTYLRDGNGFESASETGSAQAIALTSGDVRGDSRPELITVSEARSSVDILEWTSASWTTPESVSVSTPTSVAVGDVDADGQNDLVVGHAEGATGHVTVVRRVCM